MKISVRLLKSPPKKVTYQRNRWENIIKEELSCRSFPLIAKDSNALRWAANEFFEIRTIENWRDSKFRRTRMIENFASNAKVRKIRGVGGPLFSKKCHPSSYITSVTLPIRVPHGKESTRTDPVWVLLLSINPRGIPCIIPEPFLGWWKGRHSEWRINFATWNGSKKPVIECDEQRASASWKLETCQWRYRTVGGTSFKGWGLAE